MTVCGVIAEYDPFHRGHERHLLSAREKTQADFIVCLISGSFTQRGMPALLPGHARAEMALGCGADIVLQLPYAFSVREAEYFALGGVFIFTALKCVTHLSFGCEGDAIPYLSDAADLLESPDESLNAAIQAGLDRGLSHAAAVGAALEKRLQLPAHALDRPNTALALSYLRAIRRLRSPLIPVPVVREGDYHADELSALPSASALRLSILRGDWAGVRAGIPENAMPVLERTLLCGEICPPAAFDPLIRRALCGMTPQEAAELPGVSEGLEMRILKAAQHTVAWEALIAAVKTRRYTYGRVSRCLCHAALGVTKADLPALPACARILGFRESARGLVRQMQKSALPLITRPAKSDQWEMDLRADDLWRIAAGLSRGESCRRAPVILP